MERRVLVTGGTGFIGGHLVRTLLAQGHSVRVLVRSAEARRRAASLGAEPVFCDLLQPANLEAAVSGVHSVFHLAGRLFVPGTPPSIYQRLHVDGTASLLKACASVAQVDSFLLCTSTGVLGPTASRPGREEDPARPQNSYEESKARAEDVARDIAATSGLPLVIARPGLVYGPGDRHLLGLFRAIQGGYYRVIGPGTNQVHPVYVTDVVEGLLLAANAGQRVGRAYNLVGAGPVTMRELSDAIGRAVGRQVSSHHLPAPLALGIGAALEAVPVPRRLLPLTRSRVRFMTQQRVYDGARAAAELGFAPHVDIATGLAMTVEWYRDNHLLA